MKFLLVPQQEVSTGKTSRTLRTLEWLLLGMRSLMALQMLQSSEGSLTSAADVRSRFVGLWWGEIVRRLRSAGSACHDRLVPVLRKKRTEKVE